MASTSVSNSLICEPNFSSSAGTGTETNLTRGWCQLSSGPRQTQGNNVHLSDTLIHSRVGGQRRDLAASQLGHSHLTLLARELSPDQANLLLCGNSLRLNLPHELNDYMSILASSATFFVPLSHIIADSVLMPDAALSNGGDKVNLPSAAPRWISTFSVGCPRMS